MGKKQPPKLPTDFPSVLPTAFPRALLQVAKNYRGKQNDENDSQAWKCKLAAPAGMKLVFAL